MHKTAQILPSLMHLVAEHHGEAISTCVFTESVHPEAFRREEQRGRRCGTKPGSPPVENLGSAFGDCLVRAETHIFTEPRKTRKNKGGKKSKHSQPTFASNHL